MLSLSVDSVYVHKVWNETEISKIVPGGVPFPMLSDPGGRIGTLYSVYNEDKAIDLRGTFIIDPDGTIQGYQVLTSVVGRSTEEILRQIRAFQLVRASNEREFTPADWKPGTPALKPSIDLVGRVWEMWKPGAFR
mgnify:FL=1